MQAKIITGYDGVCSYRDLTIANFSEYCKRWGYDLVTKFDSWGPIEELQKGTHVKANCAVHQRRWQLIAEELHDCDWLVWWDADVVVMNMTIPITDFVDDTIDLAITGPFHPCSNCGAPVYSSGIMFIRCCDWSKDMMQKCLAEMHTVWQKGPTVNCHDLPGNNWFCCKYLPEDMNMLHVKVIPPALAGYYTVVTPGQFLVHLYGNNDFGRTRDKLCFHKQIIR